LSGTQVEDDADGDADTAGAAPAVSPPVSPVVAVMTSSAAGICRVFMAFPPRCAFSDIPTIARSCEELAKAACGPREHSPHGPRARRVRAIVVSADGAAVPYGERIVDGCIDTATALVDVVHAVGGRPNLVTP
jgi:hypothetical protein